MGEPFFLQPIFEEKIWGGIALKDEFGYEIPSEQTGECWAISGHPNAPSVIRDGKFKGKTLQEVWITHPELFGNYNSNRFPLLTKIIDARENLSVQVHPNNEYAKIHENGELGKTECWYIIDCKKDAQLILGHNAKTKEELIYQIEHENWEKLLRRIPIQPGDFFYVPSGTIHALCKGTLVLETQQSSDTTYRVYDYDRVNQNGKKRELHLKQSIDVITVPHQDPKLNISVEERAGMQITTFVKSKYFSVFKWKITGEEQLYQTEPFLLVSVLKGMGDITTSNKIYPFQKGDHFILPATIKDFTIQGDATLIVSHP
ncbi:mannose-6-phosphate isomerase, class I [Garciella nitratireducens]|uniref:mannose-6-phosphate isomerase, class I n=1 Tax=Garciella nitratireducens TaxID=218205 RepID=UPI001BD2DEF3|nr:mannose-6-phosphate isomerase, class I [Garciella nitratireducens]